ncbi:MULTISPECIES: peptidase S1 family protein [Rhodococcus]|uniref:peptidase S1 family protein n=1 Tax=Rhodococcus TaxID=1827 RepID=UPI000C79D8EA|nr:MULTISPECIES: peptidase S1 family protein [Rhodococcus]AUM18609.1 peptidase S1 family protein [Rhodococcus ruber]
MFKRVAMAIVAGVALLAGGTGVAVAAPPVPLGGGSGITLGNGAEDLFDCTLATIGNDRAGRLVGFTAGHCGGPGTTVKSEMDLGAGVLGRIVGTNEVLDYSVIEFDRGRVAPVNRVGNVIITGVGTPVGFPNVACKEGRTTGNTCGVVWGDVFNSQETWTQVCVVEGDSGAPLVVGTTLVAMVNAYLLTPCIGPEVGTNFVTILGDVDARGGVGAGYRPI